VNSYLKTLKCIIKPLTDIVKDKTGTLRSSSAILLSKLCQEPSNIEYARSIHSTEILLSLSKVLLKK